MDDVAGERDLVAGVLAGEAQALATFYARHIPVVRGVLVRMVGIAEAEDVTQEVFLRAIAHLGRFRHDASLKWWLARIAAHCGLRHLRGVRRGARRVLLLQPPAPPPIPEDGVLAREEREQARRALEGLGAGDREILELREILGLPYEEIRYRLNIRHLGTVWSRLHKARESLRRAWRTLRS